MTQRPHLDIPLCAVYAVWLFGLIGPAAAASPWNLDELRQVPPMRWLDDSSPIRSLVYGNQPFEGHDTEVFAFYATPGSISGDPSRDKNLPAVVLIHGGGGTAFAEWVWLWAKRGYAAIAMDLSGRRPSAPTFDPQTGELHVVHNHGKIERTRLEKGGPEHGHTEKFDNVGGDLTDDWQYHALGAVLRAHSLVRSFDEVNASKTAVTGISWGGYLTCLAASLDDRFKAAVPVYGCGFLYQGESIQRPLIDRLSPEKRDQWIAMYEPSAWLPQCRVPILFVNGTNDAHYTLPSYADSYNLVPGEKQIRIEVNMPHGHPPGWKPIEIGLFIDQHLRGGTPLPVLGPTAIFGDETRALVESETPIVRGQLHYTTDTGRLVDRKWQSTDAVLRDNTISARAPADATIWLLSVTDNRNAMVSTLPHFADRKE